MQPQFSTASAVVANTAFTNIANAFKSYKEPILFRLNNEMNTDWTSYSGIVSLLDPDIFITTWKRLYNIFEEKSKVQGEKFCLFFTCSGITNAPSHG